MIAAAAEPGFRKLGVVAGAGDLPVRIAAAVAASGRPAMLLRLKGVADVVPPPGMEVDEAGMAEVGKLLAKLRAAGCDAVTLAGVVRRPNFSALRPDMKGASLLPRVVSAARRGDDALLAALVAIFEEEGFRVVGADAVADDLVAPAGAFGAVSPGAEHFGDMRIAAGVVEALGPYDVGQGAVACDRLVLAVEAAEGTDAMLSRCSGLPPEIRGAWDARRGVLVKLPKPMQEKRVDLPTIGAPTIERAAAAGLAGVFVKARQTLVIDRAAVVAAADQAGLFVYGFVDDER